MDENTTRIPGSPGARDALAAGLASFDHAHKAVVAGEIGEVVAIAHVIDHYEVDEPQIVEGVEGLLHPGGDGTPGIGEFLALELSALAGVSPGSMISRIGDVLDVRHRLPSLWGAVLAGTVRWWQAADVAHRTHGLSADAVRMVDRKLAHALAMMPWQRILKVLPHWIVAADPQLAAENEAALRNQRRVVVDQIRDGHVEMWGRLAPADGIAFDQAINEIAKALPSQLDPEAPAHPGDLKADGSVSSADLDTRRAAAVGILARQAFGQDALPTHQLIVHVVGSDPGLDGRSVAGPDLLPDGSASGIARVEGWGPVQTGRLRELLAGSRVIVRPILDPGAIEAVDQHDPPAAMRFALNQRDPVDVFPYGTRGAGSCDVDHTVAFTDAGGPGQTGLPNLGPLSRFTHRLKTHGNWTLSQPEPGLFHWRSAFGYEYVVTRDGTTRLRAPARPPDNRTASPPDRFTQPDPPPGDPAWDTLPALTPPGLRPAA